MIKLNNISKSECNCSFIEIKSARYQRYSENLLDPVWVFLFVDEQPSHWALLDGAINVLTVAVHTFVNNKKTQPAFPLKLEHLVNYHSSLNDQTRRY